MVLKRVSEAAGRGAGGFLGGIANNPGIIILGAVIAALVLFRGDIRNAFASVSESLGNIGNVQLPDITLPTINFPEITFPEFPTITFPEFPTITFPSLPPIFGGPTPAPAAPPGGPVPEDQSGGFVGLEIPEGCQVNPDGTISCPTPPTFDVCATIPELCGGGSESPPIFAEPPTLIPVPQLELPPGFGGGGPSFEGGTIFPINICNKTIGQIAQENGISASAAADLKAQACETFDFDFGSNLGGGQGPGDPLIPGTSTPESSLAEQEIIAACTSCQLFNLNCDLCLEGGGFA